MKSEKQIKSRISRLTKEISKIPGLSVTKTVIVNEINALNWVLE